MVVWSVGNRSNFVIRVTDIMEKLGCEPYEVRDFWRVFMVVVINYGCC